MRSRLPGKRERDDFLEGAMDAARAAGRHARDHRARRGEVARRCAHDLKLVLDREAQLAAEKVIHRRFPGHGILGEEDRRRRAPAAVRWIIDPIDGTVNFFHGLPWWCSAVAVEVRGRVVAGAVWAPEMDEWFTARRGGRARLNGRPVRVSATASLSAAMIATGIDRADGRGSLARFGRLYGRLHKLRIMGSAALDICAVACGRTDGFHEAGIYLWDVAAAGVILEQAGGRAEILSRRPGGQLEFLGSNGRLHAALRRVVGRS